MTPEQRAAKNEKTAAKLRGRKQTAEFVMRRTAALIGRKASQETKDKIRAKAIARWERARQ